MEYNTTFLYDMSQLWVENIHFLDDECFEKNIDFYGNDIKFVSGSNPLTCQQECQQTDKCEFWTYDTSSGGIGLNCWLKTKGDYRIQNSERASGPKYCGKTEMLKLLFQKADF